MSVRILVADGKAVLYDSTTDVAFGPVFNGTYDAHEQVIHFLDWLDRDARTLSPVDLMRRYDEWRDLFTDDDGELTAAAMNHAVTLT